MEILEKERMEENHRTLLCQGPVELTSGRKRKKRHLSLFNDVLVISSNLKKKYFKIKCIIPLIYLWALDDVDMIRKNTVSTSKTFFLMWPTGNVLATFRSKEQRERWYYFIKRFSPVENSLAKKKFRGLSFLLRSINEAKKNIKITFSLQIFTEDIITCDSPLCVTTTSIDTVNDIIEKLLPKLRMTNIEDYQMWFCPGPEKAPRPLKGCEYPHDILRINFQNTITRLNSSVLTAFPPLPELLVKNLNSETWGKFILKPRDSAPVQQQNTNERPVTKRPCIVTWCGHRATVPNQDEVCTGPRANKGGKLFGTELSSICPDGKLPASLMDILSMIKTKGTKTEGIFIIPPNDKSFKILKEELDSGKAVDIKKKSIHDVAWILKEFLHLLKGSLVTAHLYDQWLAVNEIVNHNKKIAAVQSLLEKLPTVNADLLRQLFRILHEIKKNSSFNHMTSHILSVGIAPCIFFMRSSCKGKQATNIDRKISLVTFLIENAPEMFGEDITAICYETSLLYTHRKKASNSKETQSNTGNIKKTGLELSSGPGVSTCSTDYVIQTRSTSAPPVPGRISDLNKGKGDVHTPQPAPSKYSPSRRNRPLFDNFPCSAYKGGILPAPILEMLSIIEQKGKDTDNIFRTVTEKSHWTLMYKIYSGQEVNWDEEYVVTIASVLMDFISSIQGSLLCSDFYENWLSVAEESTVAEKILTTQRLLHMMPQENYLLLKLLMHVLSKIKTSPLNQLDTYRLSVRMAPYILWAQTCKHSPNGSDLRKKLSLIQIMIDNTIELFGEQDNTLLMNTAAISLNNKNVTDGDHGKTIANANSEEPNIPYFAPQEESPTGHNVTTSTYKFPQEKLHY